MDTYKSVKQAKIKAEIISRFFWTRKSPEVQDNSFYAKKARGLMAIMENQAKRADLKSFNMDGFILNADSSLKR